MNFSTIQYSSRIAKILALLSVLILNTTSQAGITEPPPWSADTREGLFHITLAPEEGPVRINALQNWVVTVKKSSGAILSSAQIFIDGGMRAHGHGLPTKPQISEYLGEGKYLIEGMRLNMIGEWTLMIGVDYRGQRDVATFEVEIDY